MIGKSEPAGLRRAGLRFGLALALGLALAPMSATAQKPVPATKAADITVTAKRITSFSRAPGASQKFGRLEFRGGLVLSSKASEFGGWSGLALEADGRRFIMVSDAGSWMTGEITYDGNRPSGLAKTRLGPLRGLAAGSGLMRARDRDAEEIVIVDGGIGKATALIAFEQNHRIGRFTLGEGGPSTPLGYLKRPPEFARLRFNEGVEAMAVMRGGPFKGAVVAFAERLLDPQRNHTGWMWPKGPGSDHVRLGLVNIGDYAVTGASSLPDGSLVILERYFRWTEGVKMRLRLVAPNDLKPGALLGGETLLEADMTYEIDNMEAVAVHRGANGETVLTLVSDDNFNHFLQRTLLLQFALTGARVTSLQH